jgi:hypothetical protein
MFFSLDRFLNKTIMKTILLMVCVVLSAEIAVGQGIRGGGFGHGYIGTALNISPDIQRDLRSSSLLGSELQLNRPGVFGGGGGYGVFGNRLLLGGSGLGFKVSDATSRGEATLSIGGGFVNVGYLVTIKDNMFSFPYIGVGANGMTLKVKNRSNETFAFGDRDVVSGDFIELTSGGMSFEAGYAFKVLTFSLREEGSHGGLMVGVQAGTYIFTGLQDWNEATTGDIVPSFSKAYSFSPYLRLTIGGGGFTVNTIN